ncbi:response regulator [Paenibacillus sp. PCH8]|uniref:response regulator n=1 Tax=Paenibacillus sp. PCH8 TaxID=2066524 RepID=UPI002157AFFF|nr:response regulator [Paenibacillus sp. PCH8]
MNQIISRILRDYLTKNQYEAVVAATGQDELQIIELIQPDYIILDIMLPVMDGIEVCREIRRRNNIPNVLIAIDPIRIEQVISNHVVKALKHTTPGDTIRIDIELESGQSKAAKRA